MSGLNVSIYLEDPGNIRARFAEHTALLTAELKTAERAGLMAIADEARRETEKFSTILPQSVQYTLGAGGLTGVVGSVAKTALSIAQGRQPGHPPSYEALTRWLQHRGNTFDVTTRRALRHSRSRLGKSLAAQEAASLHDDVIIIQRTIRERGTKGLPFILPAAAASKATVTSMFGQAIGRAIHKLAGK